MAVAANAARVSFQLRWRRDAARARAARGGLIDAAVSVAGPPPPRPLPATRYARGGRGEAWCSLQGSNPRSNFLNVTDLALGRNAEGQWTVVQPAPPASVCTQASPQAFASSRTRMMYLWRSVTEITPRASSKLKTWLALMHWS